MLVAATSLGPVPQSLWMMDLYFGRRRALPSMLTPDPPRGRHGNRPASPGPSSGDSDEVRASARTGWVRVSDDGTMPIERTPGREAGSVFALPIRRRHAGRIQGGPADLGVHPGPQRGGHRRSGRPLDRLGPDRPSGGAPLVDEVVVVDDGSVDRTAERGPGGRSPGHHLRRHPRRQGPGNAIGTQGERWRPHRLRRCRRDQLRAPFRHRTAGSAAASTSRSPWSKASTDGRCREHPTGAAGSPN